MQRVIVWIEREPGQIEQHLDKPLERAARDKKGQRLHGPDGKGLFDEVFATEVYELLKPYDGQNARDVAADLTASALKKDKTGALRKLAAMLAEIGARVVERQRRADAGRLAAEWLADFELANMTVRVRTE